MVSRLQSLPERDRRGSRARCILLTDGSDEEVARRLSALAYPFAIVDPARHFWMPRGVDHPNQAKLGDERKLLSDERREAVNAWWLAVREHASTPNWDIASTATINGAPGLLLIEAKAHAAEFGIEVKVVGSHTADEEARKGHARNEAQIERACREASGALDRVLRGWNLSVAGHASWEIRNAYVRRYQLCTRFAWAWKLTWLGVPVVLVFLGFLHAEEVKDQGTPLSDVEQWQRLICGHSANIVPAKIWDDPILINTTPLHAIIRATEYPLDRTQ